MKEEIKDEIEVVEISVISQDAVGKGNGLGLIGDERTEVNELPGRICEGTWVLKCWRRKRSQC